MRSIDGDDEMRQIGAARIIASKKRGGIDDVLFAQIVADIRLVCSVKDHACWVQCVLEAAVSDAGTSRRWAAVPWPLWAGKHSPSFVS